MATESAFERFIIRILWAFYCGDTGEKIQYKKFSFACKNKIIPQVFIWINGRKLYKYFNEFTDNYYDLLETTPDIEPKIKKILCNQRFWVNESKHKLFSNKVLDIIGNIYEYHQTDFSVWLAAVEN